MQKIDYLHDQKKHILQEFRYNRVAATMEALDWKWSSIDGIPSADQIKDRLERLLDQFIDRLLDSNNGKRYLQTCGFQLTAKDWQIEVLFIVEGVEGDFDKPAPLFEECDTVVI